MNLTLATVIPIIKSALEIGLKIYNNKNLFDAVINSGELTQQEIDEITKQRKNAEDQWSSLV